ncbi:ATP-binding protein [Agromyces sp. NPDC055661]
MTDGGSGPRIRTPDQRLRVFVSSTLKELEPERRAARAAIERLKLAPVMFELGARPHPPRQLYRAYLEQSDVFVALYWQEYGWVAPGEEISGLEDEYRLAPREMPKLIYLKQPAEREARLADLVARVRDDDTASYTPFSTVEELAELVATDLATLLAERFDASHAASEPTSESTSESTSEPAPVGRLPAPYSDAVGRERELATLLDWIGRDAQRLVTLVGPGGIGKSRLAIEVARNADARFDRVTFVALAQVRDPGELLPAIARELGVRDTGDRPLSEQLGVARAGRRDLVVLDNFEQIVDAAPDVVSLLTDLPGATFIVTSRERLRVRGEQVFDVEPLGLPPDPDEVTLHEVLEAPAVRLFRDRANAADPRFEVTDDNAADVARICRALEGVPLAIELAAARIRALTPAAMLDRLDRVLPLLVTSARDLPERQRTIQATVEWSVDLLGVGARALFERLGVFASDVSLDAVEAVTEGEPWAADVLGLLLELVDGSLLRQHEHHGVPLFSMLVPVREIASARFDLDPDAATVRRAHAEFYVRLAAETELQLRGATQTVALDRIEAERDDVRAGFRHLIAIGEADVVADAVWRLYLYWWIRGLLPEVKDWMEIVLRSGRALSPRTRAIAIAFSSWVAVWQPDSEIRTEPMEEAVAAFRSVGDEFGEGLALAIAALSYMSATPADLDRAEARQRAALELDAIRRDTTYFSLFECVLGRILHFRGEPARAVERFERARELAERAGDRFAQRIALIQIGWAGIAKREAHPELFTRAMELSVGLRNEDGDAYALEGLAACAAITGDIERAGFLLGAAEALRARTGLREQRSYVTYQSAIDAVLATDRAAEFEASRVIGRRMPRRAVLEIALDDAAVTTPAGGPRAPEVPG